MNRPCGLCISKPARRSISVLAKSMWTNNAGHRIGLRKTAGMYASVASWNCHASVSMTAVVSPTHYRGGAMVR
ncbi:hypothetical protein ACVWZM_001864 [Bradyrhizobium sp. USDA 4501]